MLLICPQAIGVLLHLLRMYAIDKEYIFQRKVHTLIMGIKIPESAFVWKELGSRRLNLNFSLLYNALKNFRIF